MKQVCNRRIDEAIYSYGKQRGITRDVVAERLGMSIGTLNLRLTGKREWKVNELLDLSEMSGVDFREFIEEVEE